MPPGFAGTRIACVAGSASGLPKAAKLNHLRFFSAIVIPFMFGLRSTDRLYCCLPLCHTAAIGAISICWWLGAPLVLARKFSVSTFWRVSIALRTGDPRCMPCAPRL